VLHSKSQKLAHKLKIVAIYFKIEKYIPYVKVNNLNSSLEIALKVV